MEKIKWAMILLSLLALSSCVTIPPLSEGGATVRRISEARAEKCQFIKRVEYRDKIVGFGIQPATMTAIGVHGIRNRVALTGANAFVLHRKESEIFFGTIFYSADAYKCKF